MADRDRIPQSIRVVAIYVIASLAWILLSDAAVAALIRDPSKAQFVNTIKGWLYVVAVAALLYTMLEADRRRVEAADRDRDRMHGRMRAMFERIPAAVLIFGDGGQLVEANRAAAALLGMDLDRLDEPLLDAYDWRFEDAAGTPIPADELASRLTVHGSRPVRDDVLSLERPDGERAWIQVSAEPLEPGDPDSGYLVTFSDITDRVLATRRLERLNSLYAVLGEVSRLIMGLPRSTRVLEQVCRVVTSIGGFRMAWVGLVDDVTGDVHAAAMSGHVDGYLDGLHITTRDEADGRGPTGLAIRRGERVVVNDFEADPGFAPWRERAEQRGYRGSAAFPLRREGRVVGALMVYAGTVDYFGDEELELLEKLADYVSFAFDYEVADRRRKSAEAELRQWADIFEHTKVGVQVSMAGSGLIDLCNPAAAEMHGYSVDELIGQPIGVLSSVPVDMPPSAPGSDSPAHAQFETIHLCKDGSTFPAAVDLTVVTDESGTPLYSIATITDITDRRRAAEELERHRAHLEELVEARTVQLSEANERLVQATIAKSQFLANMSHELRTPLNSIIGFSGILTQGLAGPLTGEQLKQIEMVNRSGRYLLSLINDVLDLSRIEAGRVQIDVEPFDVTELARSIAATVRPLAAEKGLSMTLDIPPRPVTVASDAFKVQQILINLLGNAVKFTERGSVGLRIDASEPGWITISVSDTGMGIDAADQARIFDEFLQIAPEREGKPEGTGLGLAISQRLAVLLGATITVRSAPGRGSTFVLRVPARHDGGAAASTEPAAGDPPGAPQGR